MTAPMTFTGPGTGEFNRIMNVEAFVGRSAEELSDHALQMYGIAQNLRVAGHHYSADLIDTAARTTGLVSQRLAQDAL